MKKLIYTVLTLSSSAAFVGSILVACGSSSNNTPAPAAPAVVVQPATTSTANCAIGQVQNATYGCMNPGPCAQTPTPQGVVPNSNPPQCVAGTAVTTATALGASYLTYQGSMSISNRAPVEQFLSSMGYCAQQGWNTNPFGGSYIIGFGSGYCNTYSSQGFVQIQVSGASATTAQVQLFFGSPSLAGGLPISFVGNIVAGSNAGSNTSISQTASSLGAGTSVLYNLVTIVVNSPTLPATQVNATVYMGSTIIGTTSLMPH